MSKDLLMHITMTMSFGFAKVSLNKGHFYSHEHNFFKLDESGWLYQGLNCPSTCLQY